MAAADRDFMANFAANLMKRPGNTVNASATAAAACITPRTIPYVITTSNENVRPARVSEPEVKAPPTHTQAQPVAPSTISATPAKDPKLTERDNNLIGRHQSQLLVGNADALAEAREFMQSASHGRQRPSRPRLISRERTSNSSTASSPRTRTAALSASMSGVTPAPMTTTTRSHTAKPAAAGSLFALHDRPPVSAPNSAWTSFAQSPTSSTKPDPAPTSSSTTNAASDHIDSTAGSKGKVLFDEGKADASPSKKVNHLKDRQMGSITNTLKSNADDLPPPHLRAKTAMTSSVVGAKPAQDMTKAIRKASDPAMSALAAKPADFKPIMPKQEEISIKPCTPPPTVQAVSEPTKTEVIVNSHTSSPNATVLTTDNAVDMLKVLQKDVTALTTKISRLEKENWEMMKQLESIAQVEERRKFLGTVGAKTPYSIEVAFPSGNKLGIQVTAEMKVADLIRRARIKADISAVESPNPRIMLNGEQKGHSMTLGESGISKEEKVEFVFG